MIEKTVITVILSGILLFTSVNAQSARAYIINTQGDSSGYIDFTQTDSGVVIQINLRNLPEGSHALHIHQTSECVGPDYKSAGGHFNPTNKEHGFLNPKGPHAGDLPNIDVNTDGTVKKTFITKLVSLKKGTKNSLLKQGGTAVAVHQNPDDYISQPSGGGGPIIACGVIKETADTKKSQ